MGYQFELRHLRYFLAVAETLHFKKAADKLFISQPALSKQIKQLEEAINIELFERHNRKVALTSAGQYLQEQVQEQLKQLEHTIRYAQLLSEGMEGQLRFGYLGSAMQDVIPRFLVAIREQFPRVLFDLKPMDNTQQIEAIINQEIDFGFVRLEKVPRDIEIHPVFEDTFSLVVPENHPINLNNFNNLAQFKEEPFILFDASYSQSYFNQVMQLFEESGFQPIISHKTVHANTIYNLVENNFGVSIVPTSLKKGYDMAIRFIELKGLSQRTTLQMIWSKQNQNPVIANVLALIRKNVLF